MPDFTYRSARSTSLVVGLGIAIFVETLGLHLWLSGRHPLVAWALTLSSLAALWWLAADHQALGRGAVRLGPETLDLRVGRRWNVAVPRAQLAAAVRPTWRDLPEGRAPDYVDLTKPAEPNVLLTLDPPLEVPLPTRQRRLVRRIALHLDDPDAFVAAVGATREPEAPAPGATT